MRHYCTYFDSNYLLMGLALYESLLEHSSEPFVLWVLCFDKQTFEILDEMALPRMHLISQNEFESADNELLQVKKNRSKVEYYWTCTPSLPLYVFAQNPEINQVTYLDADLYFFSDPAPIFEEFGENSIMILEHRFPPELQHNQIHGKYNVSLMIFRRDNTGITALKWWRGRCIKWCYNRVEDGKFGDQKYLDDWTNRFGNLVVLQNEGAGLAPWNMSAYRISQKENKTIVNGTPLVFFHFHRFHMMKRNIFAPRIEVYTIYYPTNFLTKKHIALIYHPYANHVKNLAQKGLSDRLHTPNPQNISWVEQLALILKGEAFLIKPKLIALIISRFTLWRSHGDWLARRGFMQFEQNRKLYALKYLIAAAIRRPEICLPKKFREIFLR